MLDETESNNSIQGRRLLISSKVFGSLNTSHNNTNRFFLLPWLLAFSVYSKELFGIRFGESDIDLFQLSLAVFGAVAFGFQSLAAIKVGVVWATILAIGYVLLNVYGYASHVMLRQGLAAMVVYVGIAGILSVIRQGSLLHAYRKISFWVASFGLLQFALSLAGVMILIKARGRLDSICDEPSHYAIAISPAVYLAVREVIANGLFRNARLNVENWVVIASSVATLSLTAIAILLFCIFLVTANSRTVGLFFAFVALCGYIAFNSHLLPEQFRERVDSLSEVAEGDVKAFKVQNLTVFSAATNLEVAFGSIAKGRLLGNGFGGHVSAYSEHVEEQGYQLDYREGTNAVSGHSLLIRVFSEFGVIGLLVYLFWMMKALRSRGDKHKQWWTLSGVYFFGRILKLGGYFEVGMPIFFLAPLIFNNNKGYKRRKPLRRKTLIKPWVPMPGNFVDGSAQYKTDKQL